jgi:6-phosphogluconolactonase
MLNRSRKILWLVTGADKVGRLPRLLAADPAIPAGRIRQDNATVMADRTAAPDQA